MKKKIALMLTLISVYSTTLFANALDDYVYNNDGYYSYSLYSTQNKTYYMYYVLNMTSQKWLTSAEVNKTLWQHWLHIIIPASVTTDKSLLFVSGGSNSSTPETGVDTLLGAVAFQTHSVVAYLETVPNEPLTFTDETSSRTEDEIIAYSWDKFLTTLDPNWIAQLPMTKAAVKAMDTVETFCATKGKTINNFVVAGASKRGWTTWLTAAVDTRVVACLPIVIDMLNMELSFRHHFSAYGFWAPAVYDYEDMNIFGRLDTEEMDQLAQIVDPYAYKDRLTMPKLMLYSSGDDFFLPDSSQFYFDDLPGQKYLRYVPNTNHSMGDLDGYSEAFANLLTFYQAILAGSSLPQFSWTADNNAITVHATTTPTAVKLWQAYNAADRDFRMSTIGQTWTSTTLTNQGGGIYIAPLTAPATGYKAYFVELEFASGFSSPHKFTTSIYVAPDYLPYECDFNFDSMVNTSDLKYLADNWLTDNSAFDVTPGPGDGIINLMDFARLTNEWLDVP